MTKTTHYKERNLERVSDDIGKIYWMLTIKSVYYKKMYSDWKNKAVALCSCVCWNEKEIIYYLLKKWDYKSCWCMNEKKTTKSMHQTRQWRIRYNMIKSTRNPTSSSYHRRWARGITVQDNRKTFAWWWEENKDLYSDELYFTRVNPFKNFTSDNCVWSLWFMQSHFDLIDKYKE